MYGEKDVERALREYERVFGEGFPVYNFFANRDIDGLMKEIKKAIETGKPYNPDTEYRDGKPVLY